MRANVATKRPTTEHDGDLPAGRRGDGRRARRWFVTVVIAALALCVALVGAIAASGTLLRPASRPARAATPIARTHTPQRGVPVPNPTCYLPAYTPRMLTPQEIEHPLVAGHTILPGGAMHTCVRSELLIPRPAAGAPTSSGQVILVSLSQQWLWAYQNGTLVFATPVTTGMPYLWTPPGVYTITQKVSNTTFYSPWPPGSPYYYSPEHVNYAMLFRHGGYFIHDAPWRHAFGPGTQVPHTDPDGTHETGSHGCINLVTPAGAWLYRWAAIGTTVDIAG